MEVRWPSGGAREATKGEEGLRRGRWGGVPEEQRVGVPNAQKTTMVRD